MAHTRHRKQHKHATHKYIYSCIYVCVCSSGSYITEQKQTDAFYPDSLLIMFYVSLLQLRGAQGQVVGTHQKVNAGP